MSSVVFLVAGGNCNIRLTFTPTATGVRSGSLTVRDDAADSPQSITLSGMGTPTGGQPAVRLDTTSIAFDPQLITTASSGNSSRSITISNVGNGVLTITSCTTTGPNGGDFTASCGACNSVSPNTSCIIPVSFTPAATGARSATLNINSNATDSPQRVPLTGTGTDFTLGPASGGSTSAAVSAGGTATYNLQVTPVSGFFNQVTLTLHCENVPQAGPCTTSAVQVVAGPSAPGLFTVTVGTAAPQASVPPARAPNLGRPVLMQLTLAVSLLLLLTLSLLTSARRSPTEATRRSIVASAAAFALSLALAGCMGGGGHGGGGGGGGRQGTPPGTYTLGLTAGVQSVARNLNLTLTVH